MITDEHLDQILNALEAEFGAFVLITRSGDELLSVTASFESDHDDHLRRTALKALQAASQDWPPLPQAPARA
jgi:hypothetical protein